VHRRVHRPVLRPVLALLVGLTVLAGVVPTVSGPDVAAASEPSSVRSSTGRRVLIVAAENFWGSIVQQLAGRHGTVMSIIRDPSTDPHDYEARPSDARLLAAAEYAVVNGAGYDAWATKILDANPTDGRRVLDVGALAKVEAGGNPHLWYSPAIVEKVVARVTADLGRVDPGDAAYFRARRVAFESHALARYHDLIATIRTTYGGTPVGASESIFTPMARALGLVLLTPSSFLDAVAEGTDPTAGDKATVDAQIEEHRVDVFVFNTQNATPDVKQLVKTADADGIPVTSITETLTPAGATFQVWQSRQLAALEHALAQAKRRQ
jgi:zinc/manganese transport system substrate-binding protein